MDGDLITMDDMTNEEIVSLLDDAERILPLAHGEEFLPLLKGKLLANMFFEPSTRTRISFGASFNLLGGNVREITEVGSSSLAKGESLADTAQVLSGYSDIIVMRHPENGSVKRFADSSRVPVINAGDGSNEHPSQALLDLYTIQKELSENNKTLDGLRIALVGDLKYGRAVHSLCKILSFYSNVKLNLISPKELKLPPELLNQLNESGLSLSETENLEEGISEVDIIYITRIQEERFKSKSDANKYRGLLSLNQSIYTANCEPNTVIMHPLPRDSRSDANELDSDLYENPNLAIFRQADNGVVIRMAMFALVLGIENKIEESSRIVNWKVGLDN